MRVRFVVSPFPAWCFFLIFSPSIDLMWSDPDDVDNWAVSPRGAGWLFGRLVTHEVLYSLNAYIQFLTKDCSLTMSTVSISSRALIS